MLEQNMNEVITSIRQTPPDLPTVRSKYQQVKFFIKLLQEWADNYNEVIKEDMIEQGQRELPILDDDGKKVAGFYLQERKKYEYPAHITKMEEDLKKAKKITELDGTATSTSSLSLVYR